MGLTNAMRQVMTQHLAGITPFTAPATYYLGFANNFPGVTDADNGTGFTEISGGGYTRKPITWNPIVVSACAAAGNPSSVSVVFDAQTADWGINIPNSTPYASMLLFDAETGGDLIAWTRTYNFNYSTGGVGYVVTGTLAISMAGWVPSICVRMLKHFTGELSYSPGSWYIGYASFPNLCAETYTDTGSARAVVGWEPDPDFPNQATNDGDLSVGQSGMSGLAICLFDASSGGNLAETTTVPPGVIITTDGGASVDVFKTNVLGLRVA